MPGLALSHLYCTPKLLEVFHIFTKLARITLLFFGVLLLANSAQAEQRMVGPYEINYSVFNSTFISADVAKQYGIVRGKDRGLVNIAVRMERDGKMVNKAAHIVGTSSDLIHKNDLRFREVREQDAIYYIAEFRFAHKDLMRFKLKVQPDPNADPYRVEFIHTLWHE